MDVNIALLTVTDTRTFDNDKSGSILVEKIKEGSQNGLNNKNLAQFVGEYVKQIAKGIE